MGKVFLVFKGSFHQSPVYRYVQNSIYLLLSNSVSPQLFPTDSLATKKTVFHSNASNYNDQLNRYLWTTDFHKEVQQLFMYKVICKKRFLVCVLRMNPDHLLQNFVCITGNIWHQDLCFTPRRDLLLLLKKNCKRKSTWKFEQKLDIFLAIAPGWALEIRRMTPLQVSALGAWAAVSAGLPQDWNICGFPVLIAHC